jgi:hypothetical protein
MLQAAHLLHCSMTSNSANRLNALVLSWHKIQSFIVVAIGLLHSQPFTYSHCYFLLMVKLANSKCCFSEPKKEIDDTDMQCVKLHFHVEGSQLITDHFFRPLKQHLGGHQFHSKNTVKMAVHKWLCLTGFYCDTMFNLMQRWDKYLKVLKDYY